MSSGNQVALRYVAEGTIGTTPVDSANWQELRYTTAEFNAEKEKSVSAEVRSDRQRSGTINGQNTVAGPLNYELSMNTYDDFFEAVMGGTWTADVLKVGSTQRGFSFEQEHTDLTTAFRLFKGMEINEAGLSIPFQGPITGSFGFMGRDEGQDTSSAVGAGSSAAVGTERVVEGSGDVSGIKIDTVAIDTCPQSIEMAITNNMTAKRCVGSSNASGHILHTVDITIAMTCYLNDTIWGYYGSEIIDNTDMEFEFTVGDGTNSRKFNLPAASCSSPTPPAPGLDNDIVPTLLFTGHYDATDASTLVITRT